MADLTGDQQAALQTDFGQTPQPSVQSTTPGLPPGQSVPVAQNMTDFLKQNPSIATQSAPATPAAQAQLAASGYGMATSSTSGGTTGVSVSTPANQPSSSASVGLNNTASQNINGILVPAKPTTDATMTSITSAFPSLTADYISKLDPTSIVNLGIAAQEKMDAQEANTEAKNTQAAAYSADLAAENAQYGQLSQQLVTDRANSISTAKQSLGSANSSAVSSDNSGLLDTIGVQYDQAQATLTLQAQQAKAALDSGNANAYAQIQTNMQNVMSTLSTNIQNLLSTDASNATQAAEFQQTEDDKAATLAQNDQVKNQGIADKELQTITTATAPDVMKLPDDTTKFTAAQMATLSKAPGYDALIKSGMSPNDALGYIKNAATGNTQISKENAQTEKDTHDTAMAQIAASRAATYAASEAAKTATLQNAAILAAGSVITTSSGYKYVDGTQFFGNDQKNVANGAAVSAGAKMLDKAGIDSVNNIEMVKGQITMLQGDLAGKLGAGSWGRLISAPVNAGKTLAQADPTLSSLNIYKDTAIKFLQAMAGGTGSGLRITASEIQNQMSNLPDKTDTIATAAKKIDNMNAFLNQKEALLFPGQKATGAMVTMTGPKGTFQISSDKVDLMKANGYSEK